MTQATQSVGFAIEPAVLHEHARALLLEANWRGALSFLMESVEGPMTLDLAVEVLQGKVMFADLGEGLQPVPQDLSNEKFRRQRSTFEWQHAGLLQVGPDFYQPYARVLGFDADDKAFAMTEVNGQQDSDGSAWCDWTPESFRRLRARYYAEDRHNDRVEFAEDGTAYLFCRRPDPPFWHTTTRDPMAAVQTFLAQRRLTMHGQRKSRTENDPRHWRFYEDLLDKSRLDLCFDGDALLTPESQAALEQLVPLQDALSEARSARQGVFQDDDPEWDRAEDGALEDAQDALNLARLRLRIREQAELSGGFTTLQVEFTPDELTPVEVPAQPLYLWASRNWRDGLVSGLAPWKPVCPQGLKMMMDNPIHTDWLVGAGYDPRIAYDMNHPLNKAAWRMSLSLAREGNQDFVVLAGTGKATGRVVFPRPNEPVPDGCIAVVPFAGVDYEMAMLSACKSGRGAVVAATGGKLAHLPTVARETASRVAVLDNATQAFTEGELVALDFDKGILTRLAFNKY